MSEMNEENSDELEIHDYLNEENKVMLQTHQSINRDLCGEIENMEVGHVEIRLITTSDMVADDQGLIHGGFIFSAADYAAMAAVNEANVVLVACDSQFLSPVKFGDEVLFKAKVRHKEGRKRNVHVTGYVLDIKVFDGEFKTVVTDKHVLKLKLIDEEEDNSEE